MVILLSRVRFGAAVWALDIWAPDIWAPGLSGTRIFFLDSFVCSYVVSVCSSRSTAFKELPASLFFLHNSKRCPNGTAPSCLAANR